MSKNIQQLLIKGEDFLCERHLKRLLAKLVDEASRDFNFDRIGARDVTAENLLQILKTQPMMSDSRTVVVADFELVKKDVLESLSAYFQDSNPQTNVILIAEKVDKRTSFYKNFSKVGEVIEFKPLYPNQLSGFVQAEAKDLGLALEPGCAELLAELVGNNLMSLVSELEKLALYVGEKNKITCQHVRELIGHGLLDNVFVLGNLIGAKKYFELTEIYRQLLSQGEAPARLLNLVSGHFRKLLIAQACLKKNRQIAPQDLAQEIGVHPFFVKDYLKQVQLFKGDELEKLYRKTLDLFSDLRSSRVSEETGVESFFQQACL